MNSLSQIVLAIESAICGGSISLLGDGVEIGNWIGNSDVSKAEDLLANIDSILTSNDKSSKEIDLIAVSAGPGSFTGIRIGIATALGLKAGLGIGMASESALKAMAFTRPDAQNVFAALPIGRHAVCLQSFKILGSEAVALAEPRTMTEDEFVTFINSKNDAAFVLHDALYEKVAPSPSVVNFGDNIAFAIGRLCRENSGVVTEPLFISKTF